jgi:GDP/UDP-N,N'-diacetylbacillosamine 2-epimerase (hydrolysing)
MNRIKKICVVTGTRAEYGLLYWLMKGIKNKKGLELQLIVTGSHLSHEFGLTYKQIEADGFKINRKVGMQLSSDTASGVTKSMGLGMIGFADAFEQLNPDITVLLGDRFEIFAAAAASTIARIPIAHLHGGELTQGAFDEALRHSITKMSHLHFTSTEEYKQRVIQLGEDPSSVFNLGAPGVEYIERLKLLSRKQLESSLNFTLGKKNLLVTYHPVTLEDRTSKKQLTHLLKVLDQLKDTKIIFTKSNADTDGRIINDMIDEFVTHRANTAAFTSLGQKRYLSLMSMVDAVVGNSSSGIIETPSFKIGTINIGDRQKGRVRAKSVIDCEPNIRSIKKAINILYNEKYQGDLKNTENPYGGGHVSRNIINVIFNYKFNDDLKKKFFDISV